MCTVYVHYVQCTVVYNVFFGIFIGFLYNLQSLSGFQFMQISYINLLHSLSDLI